MDARENIHVCNEIFPPPKEWSLNVMYTCMPSLNRAECLQNEVKPIAKNQSLEVVEQHCHW